jgi:hypothetical protein
MKLRAWRVPQPTVAPALEVYGLRGAKSKPFTRTFKSQAAFEAWLATDAAGDVSILGSREVAS